MMQCKVTDTRPLVNITWQFFLTIRKKYYQECLLFFIGNISCHCLCNTSISQPKYLSIFNKNPLIFCLNFQKSCALFGCTFRPQIIFPSPGPYLFCFFPRFAQVCSVSKLGHLSVSKLGKRSKTSTALLTPN